MGMHKNVAVPMRLAKRHDLTKSQISMQIYQNHATRHDLVHSLYLFQRERSYLLRGLLTIVVP